MVKGIFFVSKISKKGCKELSGSDLKRVADLQSGTDLTLCNLLLDTKNQNRIDK